jgi:hypothetical protein
MNHDEPRASIHEDQLTEQSGEKVHSPLARKDPHLIAVAGELRTAWLDAYPQVLLITA